MLAAEAYPRQTYVFCFRQGMVSLDYAQRGWALGGTSHVRLTAPSLYTGRGWKARMEADAKRALEEIYKDEK